MLKKNKKKSSMYFSFWTNIDENGENIDSLKRRESNVKWRSYKELWATQEEERDRDR